MSDITQQKKRKRSREEADRSRPAVDEEITDPSSDEEEQPEITDEEDALESEEEFEGENPADKRRRLAKQYLENLKSEANVISTEGKNDTEEDQKRLDERPVDEYNNFDAGDLDKDIIASRLKEDVAEQQGRVFRHFADKLLISEAIKSFTRVGENNLTCISCFQPVLNKFTFEESSNGDKNKGRIFAYTVSKDLQLTKYDVTDFSQRPKKLKYAKGGAKYIPENKQEYENTTDGHYDEILTVAASPDGKYVVTGGRDRKLIIWSTESLSPVKVIPTKDRRGEVLSLAFRKNSDQLYASCADFKIRTYSINQFSQLEILYGHHDIVEDVSALTMERCVTVGARDKTAMLWKIPDETRLTFRGGDEPQKLLRRWMKENAKEGEDGKVAYPDESEAPLFFCEGSIDVVSMVDDSHFITGSDNGSICLWSLAKKKPIFTERIAHGILPEPSSNDISGETDEELRKRQLQGKKLLQPFWITSLYAIPYSDVFISGSWNGFLKVWKTSENLRSFELLGEISCAKGVVTKIQVVESGKHGKEKFRILASVAKEHRLGRWIANAPGARNGIYSAVINQTTF
ncbi:Rrp9p [Saccharomyces cerevisiae x Saccharomyces kudriavzevii VIN7]|uniref:Rrp9p n=1 Tax=Saccharomyces cerevisiae x Saccharomyces kudriavzevii (strain VIN7) TaxID=1095631 RepID=H0H2J2_SACCK|nr:Rrp9p [Saccharomyces cerevisiae x Saccharomyces kudriavzevii VIN7]